MIWDRIETLPREDLERLQLERLRTVVRRVYQQVPFYRRLLGERGLKPNAIKSLDDIRLLPFTTKADLRDNYPFGLFAVPREKLVRIHASSGTTGRPTVVGYTRKDLATWSDLVARVAILAGVTPRDTVQICFSYGLFTGGFGLHYGLERVGATVIPASAGNTARQIRLMQDFGTTALVSTPSYALYMAEQMEETGIDPRHLRVRLGLFGGEPWSEGMRAAIERRWGMKATDNYGMSELTGPGVAGECHLACGMHIAEDHFIPEIIDPETGEPLPPGEEGELVITTLTKEALPLLRYRTRDITRLDYAPCACGRTTVRMQRTSGRTDDMLIIRGVNVFPSQVAEVISDIPGVGPEYLMVVDRKNFLDDLEVQVELAADYFTGEYRDLEVLEAAVRNRLQAVLSLTPRVKLVEYRSLERTTGKARRVIDKRN
ncbi:MAG: phenylacetate--CoA ligase [Thermoanaerobacterales bacterium]|nr:phenylacetate--CoA ligase [Bacillota bacterium]MDI6907895.1 phenylacetate--CoA ligase [Thermoanaerobacterales bacterium]